MHGDEDNVFSHRGLLEILQLDLLLQEEVLQPQTHSVSWHLELMGDTKDGVMKVYSVQRDFVGLAPLVMVKSTNGTKSLISMLSSSPNLIPQSPFPPQSSSPPCPPKSLNPTIPSSPPNALSPFNPLSPLRLPSPPSPPSSRSPVLPVHLLFLFFSVHLVF